MTELISKVNHNMQNSNKSKYQEMNDYLEIIKIERKNYIKKKTILHTISECLHEDKLNVELKNKIRSILLSVEVNGCMDLKSEKLLDLTNLDNIELSFNEQEILKCSVQNKLQLHHKNNSSSNGQEEMLNSLDLFQLALEDKKLFDERKKLNDVQEMYVKNLKQMYDLLLDLLQLRFINAKELVENKLDEYLLKSRMYHLRNEMMKEKTKIECFNETSISFQAYKEFFNHLSEQEKDFHKEIADLTQMKEKYDFVKCKEYNEILKSYLQYKNSMERMKNLYSQLKEK